MRKADILKIEKHLYATWLDLDYAYELTTDSIEDMQLELKSLRHHKTNIKRMLDKAEKYYIELYGRKPKRNK